MKPLSYRVALAHGIKCRHESPFVTYGIKQQLGCDELAAIAGAIADRLLWLHFSSPGEFVPPTREMFPAPSWRAMAKRYAANAWQRNQVIRLYGQLLARELHALGVAVLEFHLVDGQGRGVFSDDPEDNASMTAALWSGLRTNGVAMALGLAADGSGNIDWSQAELSLVSGVPFVVAPGEMASAALAVQLLRDKDYRGVICARVMEADETLWRRLLNDGWHLLLYDGADAEAVLTAMAAPGPVSEEAQRDAELRLAKRVGQLRAVAGRGDGFAYLDRDPEYRGQRHFMARKLDIEDGYTDASRPARYGSLVRFHYILYDDGGREIERSSSDGVRAVLGRGTVIPGLEQALLGRCSGDRFSVRIQPEDAYGAHDADLRFVYPIKALMLPPESQVRPGLEVTAVRGPGDAVHARIVEVNGDKVVLDGNHPLAGKQLQFEVRVEQVI